MTLKEKIQKLIAKAMSAGVTDEEADAFMSKAQELMAKHGISEADLAEFADHEENWKEYNLYAEMRKNGRYAWHPVDRTLTSTIAKFTGCFTYVNRPVDAAPAKVFYGLEQEVELANWILAGLREKFDRDWENFRYLDRKRKSPRYLKQERKDFTLAFALEISRRVDGFHTRTKDTDSTALVVQKTELARRKLEEQGHVFYGSGVGGNWGSNHSAEAAGAGKASAASAELGRGVGHTTIQIGHG